MCVHSNNKQQQHQHQQQRLVVFCTIDYRSTFRLQHTQQSSAGQSPPNIRQELERSKEEKKTSKLKAKPEEPKQKANQPLCTEALGGRWNYTTFQPHLETVLVSRLGLKAPRRRSPSNDNRIPVTCRQVQATGPIQADGACHNGPAKHPFNSTRIRVTELR